MADRKLTLRYMYFRFKLRYLGLPISAYMGNNILLCVNNVCDFENMVFSWQ